MNCMCSSPSAASGNAVRSRPWKIGLYLGSGSKGAGAVEWARLLQDQPRTELTLLDGEDVRAGALGSLDILGMPGGFGLPPEGQSGSLAPEGLEAVRRFVAGGGLYFGTCCGLATALNEDVRARLVAFKRIPGAGRGAAILPVELTERGAAMLGLTKRVWDVRYSMGPTVVRTDNPGDGESEVLATYAGTLGRDPNESFTLYGLPALVRADYGKGKVLAFGCHPELYEATWPLFWGGLHALTGETFVPVRPAKRARPLRVAFFAGALGFKKSVRLALDIDARPDVDLTPVVPGDLGCGVLRHEDVLVMPEGVGKFYGLGIHEEQTGLFRDFLRRGGRILATGAAAGFVPEGADILEDEEAVLKKVAALAEA